MPTAADRGREVRQRLVGAAAELIVERGWTAVSTRLVAERAGVGSGLVHYHFGSVQALLSEASLASMRRLTEELGPLLAGADTPAEAVDLLVASLSDYTGSDPTSVLFVETYLAATRDPRLRAAVAGVLAEFRDRLASWLGERGVADSGAVAAALMSALDGLVLHWALGLELTAETIKPVLVRMLTHGGDA